MNSDIYNLRFIVNCEMACLSAFRNSYCNATEHTLDDRPSPDSGLYRYTEDDNRRRSRDLRDELLRLENEKPPLYGTTPLSTSSGRRKQSRMRSSVRSCLLLTN